MEQVSFKVSLITGEDQMSKSQVRRFEMPQDCSTSYLYLKEKLRSVFSDELGLTGFNITWQDQDEDTVTVESDEELIIAMQELKGPVYKFNILSSSKASPNQHGQENHPRSKEVHPGVVCDGCQGQVAGFRYKCMKCFDYDLCGSCEAQGLHPGHNMMRIGTPDGNNWPSNFFNQLNKMQKRAPNVNSDESAQVESCRFPRGTGCPRSFGRGFHTRGVKRGCRVVPPPFCWISNQQYCNSTSPEVSKESPHCFKRCKTDDKSPMTDLLNVGEVMKATEEAVRTALAATTLNDNPKDNADNGSEFKDKTSGCKKSESANGMNDLHNIGEVMKAIFGSFGVDLNATKMNSDNSQKNTQEESNENSSGDKEKATESEMEKNIENPSGTKPKAKVIPVTIVENQDASEEAMEEAAMPLSPKIKVALQAMENMGFNNDDGWLSDLLSKYDGDIGKVLDLINHAKPMRT